MTHPAQAALREGARLAAAAHMAEAVPHLERAVGLAPDWPAAHLALGLALLAVGEWRRAWPECEWRRRVAALDAFAGPAPCPEWRGEDPAGLHLLVSSEQGFGDTLQFARLLPALAERAGRVTVACRDPLLHLLRDSLGPAVSVAGEGERLPAPDRHIPLLSLPGLLGLEPATIPAAPYLTAPPVRVAKWRRRLAALPGRKLGLAWASAGGGVDAARKSLPHAALAPLAALPDTLFVSLQKGGSTPPPGLKMIDWSGRLGDFAETAALMLACDAVVSIDSAPLHLAGGLGVPAYALVPFAPDWRWWPLADRTPWYPAMRVFHQPAPDDWADAVERLARALG